jgi:hypothetical protein
MKKPVSPWKIFGRRSRGIIAGIVLTICALAAFSLIAESTLSRNRLVHVAKKALANGELSFATRTNEDFFTECALLTMLYLREDGALRDLVDTRFAFSGNIHPCGVLRVLVNEEPRDNSIIGPYSYLNYPWGSRHLEALVLSAFEYSAAKTLYRILSYGSIVFLFLCAWRNSTSSALLMAPVGGFLLFGFELTTFGANPGHAPGYFIGFFALGIFLAAREWFKKASRRFVFFGVLGTLIAYFDIMTGSLQVILSLAVLFNHFFYLTDDRRSRGYWARATQQAFGIVGCFALAYVTLTAVRMAVVSLYQTGGYYDFMHLFGYMKPREGVPGTGTTRDFIRALWLERFRLTGDALTATWLMCTSAAAWIFGFIAIAAVFLKRRIISRDLATDLFIILLAGGAILFWYLIFQGHSLTHVSFMVRLIALPAAYGFMVAILAAQSFWGEWNARAILVTSGTVIVSFLLAADLLHRVWDLGTLPEILSARFSQENSDRVSCAILGMHPDGNPDGLIQFVLRENRLQPPLTLLGLRKHAPAVHIYLQRFNPGAIYETGSNAFLLGITAKPDGELLNRADGRFVAQNSFGQRREHLWAHFCHWPGDTPESLYKLCTDSQQVPVSPPVSLPNIPLWSHWQTRRF